MNTRIPAIAILAAALTVSAFSPLSAAPAAKPTRYIVTAVRTHNDRLPKIERGATRGDVLRTMGMPQQRLSRSVWLYSQYSAVVGSEPARSGCSTLIVTFENDRVSELALANPASVQKVAARINDVRAAAKAQVAAAR